MKFYVYIIQSKKDFSYYKGFSEYPLERLVQHNNFESKYTSSKVPWTMVFLQSYATKTEALKSEKVLKKYSHFQIENLITSKLNELVG